MKQDLDQQCEDLIKEEFGANCNFDVDDAVQKLEKLGIISRVRFIYFTSPDQVQGLRFPIISLILSQHKEFSFTCF